jgi:glucosamine-phosphate N-acetyltransferase
MYKIRNIENKDFYKNYLDLLKQLSIIDIDKITKPMFDTFIDKLNINHQIYVIEDKNLNIIIGTITIIIEPKLIHNLGSVCHVEDVVVDTNFRGLKLAKLLINKAIDIAKEYGCYKVTLDCSNVNKIVYEKCGFNNNGNQMSLYIIR